MPADNESVADAEDANEAIQNISNEAIQDISMGSFAMHGANLFDNDGMNDSSFILHGANLVANNSVNNSVLEDQADDVNQANDFSVIEGQNSEIVNLSDIDDNYEDGYFN